eukprot:GHRQ01016547.1.p1 GENE.GHRQ01016547.1~~GHRQ01016547.1.p1  ORF type:complete len:157 (-),score=35.58 GHRQ01016547.1:1435-1905(-)
MPSSGQYSCSKVKQASNAGNKQQQHKSAGCCWVRALWSVPAMRRVPLWCHVECSELISGMPTALQEASCHGQCSWPLHGGSDITLFSSRCCRHPPPVESCMLKDLLLPAIVSATAASSIVAHDTGACATFWLNKHPWHHSVAAECSHLCHGPHQHW